MAKNDVILAGLTSIIFTIDGQPICTLGKDIFEASDISEPAIFFTGLLKGVRDFSTVFETELRIVTAIGRDFLVKILLSPTYPIESVVQREIESIVLEERLTGKKPLEQMGWKKEDQTGFAIGIEILRIPFYTDFPDFPRSLELYTLRKIAQTFYTDFADKIRKYDFNFTPQEVINVLRKHSRSHLAPQIIDVGHPIYIRKLETTIVQTDSSLEVEDVMEHGHLSPYLKNNILGAIVSTIYTSMNSLFDFAAHPEYEGDLIIDFGGPESIGYSLFASGKTVLERATGQNTKRLFLCVMIGEKEKYVLGGKGEIPTIMEELRKKVRGKANFRQSAQG